MTLESSPFGLMRFVPIIAPSPCHTVDGMLTNRKLIRKEYIERTHDWTLPILPPPSTNNVCPVIKLARSFKKKPMA